MQQQHGRTRLKYVGKNDTVSAELTHSAVLLSNSAKGQIHNSTFDYLGFLIFQ